MNSTKNKKKNRMVKIEKSLTSVPCSAAATDSSSTTQKEVLTNSRKSTTVESGAMFDNGFLQHWWKKEEIRRDAGIMAFIVAKEGRTQVLYNDTIQQELGTSVKLHKD